MRTMYLDLASHKGLLACVTETEVISFKDADHRLGDHELVPIMEEVLGEAGWDFSSLSHLACVTGPGGFTSLRVAVAAMNTLSDQLQIPIAAIHLSDLYAARASTPLSPSSEGGGGSFVWIHSTKKNELFVRGFGKYSDHWPEPVHAMLDDFIKDYPNDAPWIGELIPEHVEAIGGRVGARRASPLRDAAAVLPSFLSAQSFAKKSLEPWYGRGW